MSLVPERPAFTHPSTEVNSMSVINTEILPFKAQAFKDGKFIEVSDADLKGKWSVVVF